MPESPTLVFVERSPCRCSFLVYWRARHTCASSQQEGSRFDSGFPPVVKACLGTLGWEWVVCDLSRVCCCPSLWDCWDWPPPIGKLMNVCLMILTNKVGSVSSMSSQLFPPCTREEQHPLPPYRRDAAQQPGPKMTPSFPNCRPAQAEYRY